MDHKVICSFNPSRDFNYEIWTAESDVRDLEREMFVSLTNYYWLSEDGSLQKNTQKRDVNPVKSGEVSNQQWFSFPIICQWMWCQSISPRVYKTTENGKKCKLRWCCLSTIHKRYSVSCQEKETRKKNWIVNKLLNPIKLIPRNIFFWNPW